MPVDSLLNRRDGTPRGGSGRARRAILPAGDPAQVTALRLCEAHETTEVEPAREEFVQPGGDPLAATLAAKIGNMARRYEDGHEPNFTKASIAELFAWCLSCHAGSST